MATFAVLALAKPQGNGYDYSPPATQMDYSRGFDDDEAEPEPFSDNFASFGGQAQPEPISNNFASFGTRSFDSQADDFPVIDEDYLPPIANDLPSEDYLPPNNEYLPPQ